MRIFSLFDWIVRVTKSWDTFALVLLGAWHWIFYFPVARGQDTFIESDLLYLFLPIRAELERALAQARLPLWAPSFQAGFPLFAEGEVGALYPLNVFLSGLFPVPVAVSYGILFHLTWAGIGMYLLCRVWGLRTPSALLAGFVFSNSGFMNAQIPHVPHVTVASWLPWLLLFQLQYWRARFNHAHANLWFVLICVSIGIQFLSGFPQIAIWNGAIFSFFGIGAAFIWRTPENVPTKMWIADSLRWFPKTMCVTALMAILGTGLAAVQLLPTTELIGLSIRNQTSQTFFSSYSLDPIYLTQFVAPFAALGQPYASNIEFWGYVGVLPLLLAILAPALHRDARTWFFVSLALISLVLALGKYTPFYDLLYNVPVFNRFRVPARFLFPFTFAIALLAAFGLEEFFRRLPRSNTPSKKEFAIGVTFALMIICAVYFAYDRAIPFWMDLWVWFSPLLWIISVGVVLGARWRLINRGGFAALVLGLAILDLTIFSAPFIKSLAQTAPVAEWLSAPRTVQAMDADQNIYRVYSNKIPAVTRAAMRAGLITNLASMYGKETATGYLDSLGLRRNDEYAKAMSAPMRNLLNIRYYLYPFEQLPWDEPPPRDSEPEIGLSLDLLRRQPTIPPTRASEIVLVSYTNKSADLPDGFLAGQVQLVLVDDSVLKLPIRLGKETADWAIDVIPARHSKPVGARTFAGYLPSVGHEFQAHAYSNRYDLSAYSSPIKAIGAQSFLPDGGLAIESISLIDERGNTVSLAMLIGQNDLVSVFNSHTASMWENRQVLPRAFVVHQADVIPDDQVWAKLIEPAFPAERVVLLSEGQSLREPENFPDQVVFAEYSPERLVMQTNTLHTGYLVLTDSWYPGWVARVDGKEAAIYRADYIFRAVYLEAGKHQVVFEFHSTSIWWGAWISGICAVIILAFGVTRLEDTEWIKWK